MGQRAVGLIAVATLILGCASAGDGTARELDKLRQEVSGLRAQTGALTERIQALELSPARTGAAAAAHAPVVEASPRRDERPTLPVVRMSPEARPAEEASYVATADEVSSPEGRVQLRSTPNGIVQEDLKADGSTASRGSANDRGRPKPRADGAKVPSKSPSHP